MIELIIISWKIINILVCTRDGQKRNLCEEHEGVFRARPRRRVRVVDSLVVLEPHHLLFTHVDHVDGYENWVDGEYADQ